MTTLIKESTSPRLPANHPILVEQVLAREQAWGAQRKKNRFGRAMIAVASISILILCAIFALA